MSKFTLTHEINCNVETFWKTFFDKEFNTKLYLGNLGFKVWKILEQTDTETEVRRRVTALPKMDVPGPVQKLFGPGFSYTEEASMKKSEGIWRWKMIPNTLADKLRTEGTVRIEAVGDRVRRIADTTLEAKIFAVGGLIESSAEKQIREGWDKSAAFMNAYLKG